MLARVKERALQDNPTALTRALKEYGMVRTRNSSTPSPGGYACQLTSSIGTRILSLHRRSGPDEKVQPVLVKKTTGSCIAYTACSSWRWHSS